MLALQESVPSSSPESCSRIARFGKLEARRPHSRSWPDRSRGGRERFERLRRKSSESYMRELKNAVDEHRHNIEEVKADLKDASSS